MELPIGEDHVASAVWHGILRPVIGLDTAGLLSQSPDITAGGILTKVSDEDAAPLHQIPLSIVVADSSPWLGPASPFPCIGPC